MLAADDKVVLPPADYRPQPPLETALEKAAVPEIRFTARLDPGETTIEMAPLADSEAVAIEHSNDQHA